MLSFLRIRNVAIVKELSLRLGGGLNVLTGETGAGKSILASALGIALGDRAEADLVRTGTETASVEAVFTLDAPFADDAGALGWLESAGLEPEDGEIVIRREVELVPGAGSTPQVRSRQYVCDRPVTLATLRRLGDLMVEVQGQHEHHALLAPETQLLALDRFADATGARVTVRDLAQEANAAHDDLAALESRLAERESRLEYLRFQLEELEALSPSTDDELATRACRNLLQNASKRIELAQATYRVLYEDDGSILGGIAGACAGLKQLGEVDPEIVPVVERAQAARQVFEEIALDLRRYCERPGDDPARLEDLESRLASYERLARKHQVAPSELGAVMLRMRAESEDLEDHEARRREARAQVERRRREYTDAARGLSSLRREAAERLGNAVRQELACLAMENCQVAVVIRTAEPAAGERLHPGGLDSAELRLSPNPGEPLRPLATIASGGELSRVMLAVNLALGARRRGRTLVFDEVDAGIGGRVAQVVGEKLKALSAAHQVLVITHLPQIASLADSHMVVEKRVDRKRTVTHVRELDRQGRIAEIARMMGGREVSPIARRHAEDMLKRSGGRPERRTP